MHWKRSSVLLPMMRPKQSYTSGAVPPLALGKEEFNLRVDWSDSPTMNLLQAFQPEPYRAVAYSLMDGRK